MDRTIREDEMIDAMMTGPVKELPQRIRNLFQRYADEIDRLKRDVERLEQKLQEYERQEINQARDAIVSMR